MNKISGLQTFWLCHCITVLQNVTNCGTGQSIQRSCFITLQLLMNLQLSQWERVCEKETKEMLTTAICHLV